MSTLGEYGTDSIDRLAELVAERARRKFGVKPSLRLIDPHQPVSREALRIAQAWEMASPSQRAQFEALAKCVRAAEGGVA